MRVSFLVLDGVFDTGLTAILDALSTANEIAGMAGERPPFELRLFGLRRRIRTGLGLMVDVEPVRSFKHADWLVVPAPNAKTPALLREVLQRRDVRDATTWLRERHRRGVGIAAACVGTFVLAEAGLLDNREATTTWSLAPFFRERYPRVRLDDSRVLVGAGDIVTAGAAMSHLDLALWLIRRVSPDLAGNVARLLLIDRRTLQAPYVVPDFLAHADPLIAQFERWARDNLRKGFSLQDAADALAVGPRTLQRRTDAVLGKSPLAFFQDLRIQRAQHLLVLGHDLEDIAVDVGYADATTLRTLLRRKLGRGVKELRAIA